MQTIANFIYPSVLMIPANLEAALARVERCIEDIRNWMLNDKLKLNDEKNEFMIIGTVQHLAKVSINSLRVGTATITPVLSLKFLLRILIECCVC